MAWLGRRFQCGVIFVCVALVGCQSSPSGRYSQRHDSAPLTTPDVSEIPDILPQPVVRTGAGNKSPYEVFGKTYWVMPESEVAGFRQRGYASWYGNKFHGHLTSNGETYDMFELTAAHKSLPIPSYVLVRNLANGKETVVRVNDRGPFHGNRIIDLSWAAASKLGYVDLGVAEVEIVAIDPESYQVMLAQRASQNMPESNLQPPSSAAVAASLSSATPAAEPGTDLAGTYLQLAALSNETAATSLATSASEILSSDVLIVQRMEADGALLYRVQVPLTADSDLPLIRTLLELGDLPTGFLVEADYTPEHSDQ